MCFQKIKKTLLYYKMLSWNKGRPIAIIKGGEKDECLLNIVEDKDLDENDKKIDNKIGDIIDMDYIKSLKKHLSSTQKRKLKSFLSGNDKYDEDDDLKEVFDIILDEASKRSMIEYKVNDHGRVQPLPRFDKTERCYIAGPTDSGKSFYVKNYLEQMEKVYPDKPIYLFSDVKEDQALDTIPNLIRVDLEQYKDVKEINPEDFENSIIVFDDIDSLEKKMFKLVSHFRDKILRRGRHDNISTCVTNHAITNYNDTRVVLNEASSITFFVKSSGTDQIKYALKKYCNMDSNQIKNVLKLPSRWVTVYKNVPRYVLHEKGVYVL